MASLRISLAWLLGLVVACGDDGMVTDTGVLDTGAPDTGIADTGTGDGDAMVATTVLNVRFIDPDETPLADVKVAVDTGAGIFEEISGADGTVALMLPFEVGERIPSVTVALEGYTIVSTVDRPLFEQGVGVGATPFDFTLEPLEVPPGWRTNFTITATGVPAGGRICASHGAMGARVGWSICANPDASWRFDVPTEAIGDAVNVWALDDTNTPVDFARIDIPAGATSVSADFDGTFDAAPTMRSMRLDFPADPESPVLGATLPPEWPGFFVPIDRMSGQQWGISTNPTVDGDDITVDVWTLTPPAGVEISFVSAAWTQLRTLHSVAFTTFVSDPGDTASIMGFPRITAGSALSDTFTIQAPAPVGDDELLQVLSLRNSGARTVWRVITEATTIDVPALPPSYDTDATFPFPGAAGTAIVQSTTLLSDPSEMPGDTRDFHNSVSREVPITF